MAVNVFLAGVGAVGSALLRQLETLPRPLRLVGACSSRWAVWTPEGIAPTQVLEAKQERTNWPCLLQRLEAGPQRQTVFVDATGSPEVARQYARLLQAGVHVVTSSKRANTFEQSYYHDLHALAEEAGVQYRYETTVGAGLPLVQVLQDLRATGDAIREIRGCASGTLTYLFSHLEAGDAFSEILRRAVANGYAEPDVREDLSGEDVVRKFMILARTAGYAVEREQIQAESLVPAAIETVPQNAVVDALSAYNAAWRERVAAARQDGKALRYVGSLQEGRVEVGVRAVSLASPLGQLTGTDNLFEIYTDRYAVSPIVVRGPGAGPEVTAAGMLADVLKIRAGEGKPVPDQYAGCLT